MKLNPVEGSSAITHERYDAETKTLTLQFKGAKAPSEIPDVEPATYRAFLAAKSKGKFFHERLR